MHAADVRLVGVAGRRLERDGIAYGGGGLACLDRGAGQHTGDDRNTKVPEQIEPIALAKRARMGKPLAPAVDDGGVDARGRRCPDAPAVAPAKGMADRKQRLPGTL